MNVRRSSRLASSVFTSLAMALAVMAQASSARADDAPPPLPAPKAAAPPATDATDAPVATTPSSTRSVDHPAREVQLARSPDDYTLLHGFRIGYGYIMNYDQPSQAFNGQSLKEKLGLRSPSQFLLGYEVVYRVVSHSWLNVILLGNAEVSGLEQSKFLPSANLLIGAELKNTFQIGVGANLSPLAGSEAHAIIAAGWTPRVGTIYTPLHFFFVPDVDGNHRMGVTTGVTF